MWPNVHKYIYFLYVITYYYNAYICKYIFIYIHIFIIYIFIIYLLNYIYNIIYHISYYHIISCYNILCSHFKWPFIQNINYCTQIVHRISIIRFLTVLEFPTLPRLHIAETSGVRVSSYWTASLGGANIPPFHLRSVEREKVFTLTSVSRTSTAPFGSVSLNSAHQEVCNRW
jgi:hypothetical protein